MSSPSGLTDEGKQTNNTTFVHKIVAFYFRPPQSPPFYGGDSSPKGALKGFVCTLSSPTGEPFAFPFRARMSGGPLSAKPRSTDRRDSGDRWHAEGVTEGVYPRAPTVIGFADATTLAEKTLLKMKSV